MTDKELLELAAKAIGLKLKYNYLGGRDANQPWDPLTDDGDALRLAVKLRIYWYIAPDGAIRCGDDSGNISIHEVVSDDIYSCVRRAITRAAAEVGKRL